METNTKSFFEFQQILEQIGDGVPDTAQYKRMSKLVLDVPEARRLAKLDPFKHDYKTAAMDLYLFLRGRPGEGYLPTRDEPAAGRSLPDNLWTDLVPWSFRDAAMVSEHVLAWGHILRHLNLPPGGTLLEYGPGTGQLLLMAARLGYRAFGVDIDTASLQAIQAQAANFGLSVATECNQFGQGFAGQKFDTILFYEAFHHAFDFDQLLVRLHDRLNPGGRVVLCGEPVVAHPIDAVPYPWGPRLDALSVFCMRRFGWMELGFTHDFFVEIARKTHWASHFHPFPAAGRANVYVLEPVGFETNLPESVEWSNDGVTQSARSNLTEEVTALRAELAAVRNSTSWRLTAPIRASKRAIARVTGLRIP